MSSKEMSFEEALKRLEEIIHILEKGEAPLEESLSLFQEGVRLRRFCSSLLKEAKSKVEVLTKETEDGGVS